MDRQFWLDRWKQHQTGFHQQQINQHLEGCWSATGVAPGSTVFVPLCGKSLDMLWLRQQGHPVLGIELSERAVAEFFATHQIPVQTRQDDRFQYWDGEGIRLLVGDFFDLQADDLAGCTAIYDRASLIALPPPMRRDYARQMARIKPADARMLLICMEYPQQEMAGPPFSVEQDEVRDLYQDCCRIERLRDLDVLAENPQFMQRGLSRMREKVYLLSAPAEPGPQHSG